MRRPSFGSIVVAVFWAVGIVVGSSAVMDDGAWYDTLRKPVLQPPTWLYSVIWPVLLCLGSVAAVVAVSSTLADRRLKVQLGLAYAANGMLNVAWTYLFFTSHRPDWALIEVPVFWASVAAMIWVASRASRTAAWFLVPYLAWVTFAGGINLAIVKLNSEL